MAHMVDHVLTDEEEEEAFAPLDHSAWTTEDSTKW
jgi:hypothetical protein